jgi:predicted transport protein
MNKLIQLIEGTRAKIDALRRHGLKETPTRTIVIDPLLEALGWDVRDPDEVQLEYPTVDGKSVDYGLKLNKKCVLLVEAKPFDDPLTDVKAITQVVAYAANDGIVWCVLTNGLRWKVYRSVESCPAPDKLMYEVSLDPRDSQGMSVQQIGQQLWRFSREEMAKGALDALGEQTFTDGKVRKALAALMLDPPRPLLKLIRGATGDQNITPQRIKESLTRVCRDAAVTAQVAKPSPVHGAARSSSASTARSEGARRAWRARRAGASGSSYDEAHHVAGKPQEVTELYRAIDRLCLSLAPGSVTKRYLAKCIAYDSANRPFCSVHVQQASLRVWLKLKYNRLGNPPDFARDVSNVGHWGAGDLELAISSLPQLEQATPLIRQSFDERAR